MTDRSLAFDQNGNIHLVYGRDRFYYSFFDGTEWTHATVDNTPKGGTYAAVAISENGAVHMVYTNENYETLKYARYDSSAWHWETIEGDYKTGFGSSIAVDAAGNPHISYLSFHHSGDKHYLKYLYHDGSTWTKSVITPLEGSYSKGTSIALDSNNNPRIAFVSEGFLNIALCDGSGWSIERIAVATSGPRHVSLTLDSDDIPHIVYRNNGLNHVYLLGSIWTIETVDSSSGSGPYSSLAVDGLGRFHVVYCRTSPKSLAYACRENGEWHVEEVLTSADEFLYSSLAVDAANRPHISYYQEADFKIKYAAREDSEWVHETIAQEGDVGEGCSATVGPNGHIHVSYLDILNRKIKHAKWQGCGWITETVDRYGNTMDPATAIAVGERDYVHIAYTVDYGSQLRHARWDGQHWITVTIDPYHLGAVQDLSLAIDGNGFLHLAFTRHNYSIQDVLYGFWDGEHWRYERIDTLSAYSPSIVVDQSNSPHIVYCRGNSLHYMHKPDSTWVSEMVDSGYSSRLSACVTLDSMDHPHISYSGFHELRYAHHNGQVWEFDQLDAEYPSHDAIAVSSRRQACIGFCDSGDMHFVYQYADSWRYEIVDTDWYVGRPSTLVLDAFSRPVTIYYDYSNGDLKYAHRTAAHTMKPVYSPPQATHLHVIGASPCHQRAELLLELSEFTSARISVYNLLGEEIRTLLNGTLSDGSHVLLWEGCDNRGARVPSGTYIVSAEAGGQRVSRRIVLLR
jgi:hypothetical protein